MNRLIATIHWNSAQRELIATESEFCHSRLRLSVERAGAFAFDEAGYFYNPNTGVLVSIIGYISNIYDVRDHFGIKAVDDVEIVEGIYAATTDNDRLSFLDELEGVYFVLIYDEKQESVYLAQSEFGCPIPVYYAKMRDKFVFGTSLKLLLREAGIERKFDMPSVRDFMSYSEIIPNERTLVEGVEKLVTQRNMTVDIRSRQCHFCSFSPPAKQMTYDDAEHHLLDSIRNQVEKMARHLRTPDYTLTLTGGWDSNLMLSFLNGRGAGRVRAVTINGGGITNEIPAVQHSLQFYPKDRVEHFTYTMDNSIFAMLPNIVWILEGYMFQSGMFLRYALSALIRDIGSRSVFLGSGADPILNTDMGPGGEVVYEPYPDPSVSAGMKELKKTIRNSLIRSFVGDVYFAIRRERKENWIRRKCLRSGFRERYNIQIEYNMKMHELMLNGFGLQGLYPFINRDTTSCARVLRPRNRSKSLYKQKVREHLGPDISSVLKKSGRVVDTENLLCPNKHWLESAMNSPFIRRILPAHVIERMKSDPASYEDSLLKVLYLSLFERLILSGEYDGRFGDAQIGDTLQQVGMCE